MALAHTAIVRRNGEKYGSTLSMRFSPLAAVHVAGAYHDEKSSSRLSDRTPTESTFLARIGCTERDEPMRSKLEADEQSPRSYHE